MRLYLAREHYDGLHVQIAWCAINLQVIVWEHLGKMIAPYLKYQTWDHNMEEGFIENGYNNVSFVITDFGTR
jgi:hypothetical protein